MVEEFTYFMSLIISSESYSIYWQIQACLCRYEGDQHPLAAAEKRRVPAVY